MSKPFCEPDKQDHGHHEDGSYADPQSEEKDPILPGMLMRLLQVARHKSVIAPVGFPSDVEHVSQKRDGSDDDIDAEVHNHARERDVRYSAKPCGDDEYAGGEASEHIAEPGNEANDAVQSKTDRCARDAEPVVEQMGQHVEILICEEIAADAGTRWQALGDRRKDIWLHAFYYFLDASPCNVQMKARKSGSKCYNQYLDGGYSSAAERLTVAQDVVGSIPTSRPRNAHRLA